MRNTLTAILEDQQGAGEDLEHLGQHHSGGGQVAGAIFLQGAGVAHGEHQRRGLQHQDPQRHILHPQGVWRGKDHFGRHCCTCLQTSEKVRHTRIHSMHLDQAQEEKWLRKEPTSALTSVCRVKRRRTALKIQKWTGTESSERRRIRTPLCN